MSYYAVAKGKTTGVFNTWEEAKAEVVGFKGAKFQKFTTKLEAEEFVKRSGKTSQTRIEDFFQVKDLSRNAPRDPPKDTPRDPPKDAPRDPPEDLPKSQDKNLSAFTDGACSGNGKKHARASYAVVWPDHPEHNYAKVLEGQHTNNRGETSAVIHAIKQARIIDPSELKNLVIYSDSMLVINTITKWMSTWKRKGWKKANGDPVANLDLVKELDHLMNSTKRQITFEHVEAHTNRTDWKSINNGLVDKMACDVLRPKH